MIVLATPHRRYDRIEQALRHEGVDFVRFRSPEELTVTSLAALQPRYVFFPHWSWKIPAEIHRHYECVIFHMTDLPFGRGGSPLQNLVARGHQETRLSALRCVEEMDAGPVYLKQPLSLHGTAEEILMRAAELMSSMTVAIIKGNVELLPQQGDPTVFKRRRPEDGDMRGLAELGKVYDFIRMLDGEGYPPAFVDTEHFRFEFSRASLKPDEIRADVRIIRKTS